jgi:ABC-type Fe3+/spermidine/putrescine transport system ATPase subunit
MEENVQRKVVMDVVKKEKVKELKRRAKRRGMNMYDYCLMSSAFYETVMRKGVIHNDLQNRMWYGATAATAVANFLRFKDKRYLESALKQLNKIQERLKINTETLQTLLIQASVRRTKSVKMAIMQELVRLLAELAVESKEFNPQDLDAKVKS